MPRFNRRFEVKRETQDGGKVRPDDDSYKQNGGKSSEEQQRDIRDEANQVGFEDFEQDYDNDIDENFDAHQYFLERAGEIDFTDAEENQFMEEYANTIISSFPNISRDDASALLMYVTRNEANRQGILENIRVRMDDKIQVGATRFVGIGEKGPISEIVFSEKELIDGVNNGNMESYVTGIGHLVESACHEVEHAKQNTQIHSKNPQLNSETLRMAKENVVARVNPEFYRKNYRCYTIEQNAFLNGRTQAKKALENLQGVFPEQIYSKIERRIDELIEFDRSADTEIMKTAESEYKDTDNADRVLTDLTDDLMPLYATDALNQYPILAYQYREDGTKKDLSELFAERDSRIEQLEAELSTASPTRKAEIMREIEGVRTFYDEMIQGDRQLLAQKEEFDKQQKGEIDNEEPVLSSDDEILQEDNENEVPKITHSDVEQELNEYYTEDTTIPEIEAYLSEKISQIYGDRLDNAGINVESFLEGQKLKIEYFEGADTYKEIIEELDSILEFSENMREQDEKGIGREDVLTGGPVQEDVGIGMSGITGRTIKQQGDLTPDIGQETGIRIGSVKARTINEKNSLAADKGLEKGARIGGINQLSKAGAFEKALSSGGFKTGCIEGLKTTIKSVNPRKLVTMDNRLSRTQEQTLTIGGLETDGNEQEYR